MALKRTFDVAALPPALQLNRQESLSASSSSSNLDPSKLVDDLIRPHPILNLFWTTIESKSPEADALLTDQVFAAVLYRCLPHLTQYFLGHLMMISGPVPLEDLKNLLIDALPDSIRQRIYSTSASLAMPLEVRQVLWICKRLGILEGAALEAWINPKFQVALRSFISNPHKALLPFQLESETDFDASTLKEQVREHESEKWHTILHVLVSPPTSSRSSEDDSLLTILLENGLLEYKTVGSEKSLSITSKGFQFLLMNRSRQAWTLLEGYLKRFDLNMVFRLALLYSVLPSEQEEKFFEEFPEVFGEDLEHSPKQCMFKLFSQESCYKSFLIDMHHIGLVYLINSKKDQKNLCFIPTDTSLKLISVGAEHSKDEINVTSSSGFIVVESNFKVYANISDPLQVSILSLFLHIRGRLGQGFLGDGMIPSPWLLYGVLTKDNCWSAFDRGITAQQIIDYLTINAHPQMYELAKTLPDRTFTVLPPTIVDAIRIWEQERQRVAPIASTLFRDWPSIADFEKAVQITGIDVIWKSPPGDNRKLLIIRQGPAVDRIKDFARSLRQ